MYTIVDAVVRFVFEGILYILPISRATLEKLRKFQRVAGLIGVIVIGLTLLGLIAWANFVYPR